MLQYQDAIFTSEIARAFSICLRKTKQNKGQSRLPLLVQKKHQIKKKDDSSCIKNYACQNKHYENGFQDGPHLLLRALFSKSSCPSLYAANEWIQIFNSIAHILHSESKYKGLILTDRYSPDFISLRLSEALLIKHSIKNAKLSDNRILSSYCHDHNHTIYTCKKDFYDWSLILWQFLLKTHLEAGENQKAFDESVLDYFCDFVASYFLELNQSYMTFFEVDDAPKSVLSYPFKIPLEPFYVFSEKRPIPSLYPKESQSLFGAQKGITKNDRARFFLRSSILRECGLHFKSHLSSAVTCNLFPDKIFESYMSRSYDALNSSSCHSFLADPPAELITIHQKQIARNNMVVSEKERLVLICTLLENIQNFIEQQKIINCDHTQTTPFTVPLSVWTQFHSIYTSLSSKSGHLETDLPTKSESPVSFLMQISPNKVSPENDPTDSTSCNSHASSSSALYTTELLCSTVSLDESAKSAGQFFLEDKRMIEDLDIKNNSISQDVKSINGHVSEKTEFSNYFQKIDSAIELPAFEICDELVEKNCKLKSFFEKNLLISQSDFDNMGVSEFEIYIDYSEPSQNALHPLDIIDFSLLKSLLCLKVKYKATPQMTNSLFVLPGKTCDESILSIAFTDAILLLHCWSKLSAYSKSPNLCSTKP